MRKFNTPLFSVKKRTPPVVITDDSVVEYSVFASVGTSASPTSATTRKISVPFQVKAFLPFSITASSGFSGSTSQALLSLGATDGVNQCSIWGFSSDGVTTSSTSKRHSNSGVVDTGSLVVAKAVLSSIASDGVTLNWPTPYSGAELGFNHIALGGDDVEISITQHQMNNTNADESFAHGLSGGAPTGLLFFTTQNTTAPPDTTSHLLINLGVWASSGQYAATAYSQNARTTTLCNRVMINNGVWCNNSKTRSMAVSSVDATNINVTYPVAAVAGPYYFWMVAIRGAKCQTGTFDCNGSTNPLTIDCAGITPKLWLGIGVPDGVDSINTVQNDVRLCIMASDGTNNASCGITDGNGLTTTNGRRWQSSTTLKEYSVSGLVRFEGTAAFVGESVVLTPTQAIGTNVGQGAYLIIGV